MATITTESERFKTLLAFGKFFSFLGWVVVVIGVIIPSGFTRGPEGLVAGLLVAVYGLILVASGQGISCFVSIENNTHATMVAQQAILSLMRGQTQPSAPTAISSNEESLITAAKKGDVQTVKALLDARGITK